MQLSSSKHYQKYKFKRGYYRQEANTIDQIREIVKTDWCPGLFNGDTVGYKTWDQCDWLYFDVDNHPDSPQKSIAEFLEQFKELKFYLITSRNHQKEKQERDKNEELTGVVHPPADRYHVLFPLEAPVLVGDHLDSMLSQVCEKYKFLDADAKGRNRFFYGFDKAEVTFNDGRYIKVEPKVISTGGPKRRAAVVMQADDPLAQLQAVDLPDQLAEVPIDREMLFAALDIANDRGVFDDRAIWVKLGMVLYRSNYDYEDWMRLSHPGEDCEENIARWQGFRSAEKVTGGSLFWFIRGEVVKGILPIDPLFMTVGHQCTAEIKDRMYANIRAMLGTPANISPDFAANQPQKPVLSGEFAGISALEKVAPATHDLANFVVRRPCRLDHPPSPELVARIYETITFIDPKDPEGKTRAYYSDWFHRVFELDAELRHCLFFDYTTGINASGYSNDRLLKTAVRSRLANYVPLTMAMKDKIVPYIVEKAEELNQNFNRVTAFIDDLKDRFPNPRADCLDRFLSALTFKVPEGSPLSLEQVKKLYRETWHLFFLRMHCHVDGTRRDSHNGYKLPMENDIVPILQGAQNQGKTTLCKWLACDFLGVNMYAELGSGGKASGFGSHDTVREVRGKLIGELGEMKIMKSDFDVETIKSFISKVWYTIDVKYIEGAADLIATISYIGTSNPKEYMSDPTGNRRYFPMELTGIDKDFLSNNHDLIGEIHSYYARLAQSVPKEQWLNAVVPSRELDAFMDEQRKSATVKNVDFGIVAEIVALDFVRQNASRKPNQLFHTVVHHSVAKQAREAGHFERITKNGLAHALKAMGYMEAVVRINGTSQRGWKRAFEQPILSPDHEIALDVNVDG